MSTPARDNVQEYLRHTALMRRDAAAAAEHALTRGAAQAPGELERCGARGVPPPHDVFRSIRTRLLGLAESRNFATVVVPVSSGSGGSFVARNLASAFAFDASKSALLIDCNLRRAAQHSALGIEAAQGGLIDYLEQAHRTPQQVQYRTHVPRLSLIPGGSPRPASAELLGGARMRALLDTLRAQYPDRYIVLDGPALNASPDALLLSELADYVVIVAAFGRDSAATINKAVAGIDPNKIAGVIFNYPP